MDEKIKELADQIAKVSELAGKNDNVISVTIGFHLVSQSMEAEIHVSKELPGMKYEKDFPYGFIKKSVKVGDVNVFCLIDKGTDQGGNYD